MTIDPQWHLFLHNCPGLTNLSSSENSSWAGVSLNVTPQDIAHPLGTSFDLVLDRINTLAGAFCEPDGAWGWNSKSSKTRSGGTLHAIDDRLMCVESFGYFAAEDWDEFLRILEMPPSETVIQLVELGAFVSANSMRMLFASKAK